MIFSRVVQTPGVAVGSNVHAQEVEQRTKEAEPHLNPLQGGLRYTSRDMANETGWIHGGALASFSYDSVEDRRFHSHGEFLKGGTELSIP